SRADTLAGENADDIATDADVCSMAEAHHAAVAHQQIEAYGGDGEDDDAGEDREQEWVARQFRVKRQGDEDEEQGGDDVLAGSNARHHLCAAGKRPPGRATNPTAMIT